MLVVVEAVADDGVHGAVGPHVEEQRQEDVEEDVWFVAGGAVEGGDEGSAAGVVDDPGFAPAEDGFALAVSFVDAVVDEVHAVAAQQLEVFGAAWVDLLDGCAQAGAVHDADVADRRVQKVAVVADGVGQLADERDIRGRREAVVVSGLLAAAAERDDAAVIGVLGEIVAVGEVVGPKRGERAGVHGGEGGAQVAAVGGCCDFAERGDGTAEVCDGSATLGSERPGAKYGSDGRLAECGGERGARVKVATVRSAAGRCQALDGVVDGGVEGEEVVEALLGAFSDLAGGAAAGDLVLFGDEQLQGERMLAR